MLDPNKTLRIAGKTVRKMNPSWFSSLEENINLGLVSEDPEEIKRALNHLLEASKDPNRVFLVSPFC